MIKLMKFGPFFGVPDSSPFVLKLETYLRLADIDYEPVNFDVRKAPKGKLPCLKVDGEIVADSEQAVCFLKNKFGDKLNEGLSAQELAQHHWIRLGLENHTYFMALAYRWINEQNAPIVRDAFFSSLGLPGKFIFKLIQKNFRRTIYGQGILRHSWDEIDELIRVDIQALENLLGDKPFFGGDAPREIDATTFGFVANMVVPEIDTPFLTHSRNSRALVDYNNRMTERLFPDYKETMVFEFKEAA